MKKLNIIEVKSEIGAGTRGASMGIEAIKIAAIQQNDMFFKHHPSIRIQHENHLMYENITTPQAKRIEGLVRIYERICDTFSSVKETDFPLVLAGDHSTAGGTIAGIKKAYPGKTLGVVWIDAHADLHSPHTTPSGNLHGMPLATALGEDNLDRKHHDLDALTIENWNRLKFAGGFTPKITPKDLVFIGMRDYEEEEQYLISKHNIRNFTVEEVQSKGPLKVAEEAINHLSHADIIYVSFDVDSLDSSISLGTGTPVPYGLNVEEAKTIINTLVSHPKTVCFELVEVNPLLDNKGNAMAEIAFDIIHSVSEIVKQKE